MEHRLTIDYGDDVLFSSGLTRGAFDEEARFLLAAKLYEVGRLSSGLAAKLCGKGRVDFLSSRWFASSSAPWPMPMLGAGLSQRTKESQCLSTASSL
jgi:hypothetical protein